jgi:methionyl-tRNA synthetase
MILADTLKRWQLLLGNRDAKLLTGTDEHGMKVLYIIVPVMVYMSDLKQIQRAASEAGMDTQAFCDMNCKTFQVGSFHTSLDN